MADSLAVGWCPGALRPMPSGDGLVARVHPPCGRLSQSQAAGLATLSRAHGNGLIDISTRANVQIRGLSNTTLPQLIEALRELGLILGSPEAEARCNVVTTPFWSRGDGTAELSAALSAALTTAGDLELPAKFGFAVDCGPLPVLANVSADIRIERDAGGEMICRADGATTGAPVTPDTATAMALDLARWFSRSGGIANGRARMATHIARGAQLPAAYRQIAARPRAQHSIRPGAVAAGFLVGVAFGQMDCETLKALARCGPLRVTPWRMLLIEAVETAPNLPGIITQPEDPLLRVVACTGAPGCLRAKQPTRTLARRLATYVPPDAILHVSGCSKGCAHPGPATVTLTADADGFGLVDNGRAGDPPRLRGWSAEAILAEAAHLLERR